MASIPRLKNYQGPAVLSYGFRPFFLLGSLYAGITILVWLPMFNGQLVLATTFAPRDWHIHEMLYGYLSAVVTGFLLTAIPNWTGRLPIQGKPLLILVFVWMAGRLAIATSIWIGWIAAAIIDASFLVLVATVTAREIMVGRNWRNLKVLGVLSILAAGNISFHLEAHFIGVSEYGGRLGIAAAIMLITMVGGRIVPSFTRNSLARGKPGRHPAPFGKFDVTTIVAAGVALLLWTVTPDSVLTGIALIAAGIAQAARLARWAGDRTVHDGLVIILHIAYAFVPLGFLLAGLVAILPTLPASAGIHAWTAGAVGTMTLAVMSRASLGHTGRALVASFPTQAIYSLVVIGALARIWAALQPEWATLLIPAAGLSWAAAFFGFGLSYFVILTSPRVKQRPN